MLNLGSLIDCQQEHKHTDECTMESYARGIYRRLANGTPVSFERTKLTLACNTNKFEEVKKCVHALEDKCDFAKKEHTIRST